MRFLIVIAVFTSGCAMKSVQEVCDERMAYGAYDSYSQCYQSVSDARADVFKQASAFTQGNSSESEQVTEKQTDMKCMKDCRAAGYLYDFCESRCSY